MDFVRSTTLLILLSLALVGCEPMETEDDSSQDTSTSVQRGTGYEQLYKVVMALAGRVPTADEISAINLSPRQQDVDMALDSIMDAAMTEDAFYDRVLEIYNDLLLTNQNAASGSKVRYNFDLAAFANMDYYEDNFTGSRLYNLRKLTNYGISRAPLELIKYIVENDRPFTQIVTADFTMINPYSAVIYNNSAGDPYFPFNSDSNEDNHDPDDFRPVNNLRQKDGTLVPAAGVLGTHAFLSKYPSTSTNVNRHRSKTVFNYFLGVDIEDLASRDGLDLSNVIGSVPTVEDPQCAVCHIVMDPVAGLFTNRDNRGKYDTSNTFQHTRTLNGVSRMVPAGYSLQEADQLPSADEDTALQWLGSRLAQDDRFAERTVRTVIKGFTGIDTTTVSSTEFILILKERFIASNFNFKQLVKEIVSSEYFLARSLSSEEDPNTYADVGAARLMTPEELNRKISSISGTSYEWNGPNSKSGLTGRHNLLYGGINSKEVSQRITQPTSLINGIQERISYQVACDRVAHDLYMKSGTLFPFVSERDIPDEDEGEKAIKKNIQFLHRHLLGEDLAIDNAEITHTYQLFLDVYSEGETQIPSQCQGGGEEIDTYGTVIPWMAVVSYLLSDYHFFYQ